MLANTALMIEFRTYNFGDLGDFFALLCANVLDHVVREQAHGEVVVRPDAASEHRDASHCEENVLHNLGTVHSRHAFMFLSQFQIIKQINL